MLRQSLTQFAQSAALRRYLKVAAFAVLACILGAYGVWQLVSLPTANDALVSSDDPTAAPLTLTAAEPLQLRIPKINVSATFEEPLGVTQSGEIETPESYETVAYYKYGPTPGEIGPAVVLGHVDSFEGPAVLFSLGQLKEEDTIEIERADGSVAIFAVERLERYEQVGFPTALVYGDLDYAGLRLITCTGTYDHGSLRYSHNLIVFAKLVATSSRAVVE